jgi:Flp pilus assembly pilin Flp
MSSQNERRRRHTVDRGASAVEYSLMISLIAVIVTAAVFGLGTMVSASLQQTQNCLVAQQSAPGCDRATIDGR